MFKIAVLVAMSLPPIRVSSVYWDGWTFFHPDHVVSITCVVKQGTQAFWNSNATRDGYFAEATAERDDKAMGKWEMTLGFFSGKRAAEKASKTCGKWVDEAKRRIVTAKGGR